MVKIVYIADMVREGGLYLEGVSAAMRVTEVKVQERSEEAELGNNMEEWHGQVKIEPKYHKYGA